MNRRPNPMVPERMDPIGKRPWVEDVYGIANRGGVLWADAPVHHRWQRHRAQTRAFLDGRLVERCACGAFGPAPWVCLDSWPDRKDRKSRHGKLYKNRLHLRVESGG